MTKQEVLLNHWELLLIVSCRITVTFRVKQQNLTPRIQPETQTKSLIVKCYILRNYDALKQRRCL